MSQHKLTEQDSYLNSPTAFHSKVMSSAGEKRVMDVVYLCFIEAFDSLTKYRLDKWTIKRIENWLNCQAQMAAVISSTKPAEVK